MGLSPRFHHVAVLDDTARVGFSPSLPYQHFLPLSVTTCIHALASGCVWKMSLMKRGGKKGYLLERALSVYV